MFSSSVTYSHLLIGVLALPGVEFTPAVKQIQESCENYHTIFPHVSKNLNQKTFYNIIYLYESLQ